MNVCSKMKKTVCLTNGFLNNKKTAGQIHNKWTWPAALYGSGDGLLYEMVTLMPGPIDEQMATFFKYDPLAVAGLAFFTVSRSAW